jgi:hypothetical protein
MLAALVATAGLTAGPPVHRACRVRMVATSSASAPAALPGSSSPGDDPAFGDDPAAFCSEGLRAHGAVFTTGVGGGAVFVGDAPALAALADASTVAAPSEGGELAAPFPDASGDEPFEEFAESFNRVCYDAIFLWIPRYKEAGFSTFRFEDFIDGRVRRLLPSMRTIVLHAAAPALLGAPFAELVGMLGFEKARTHSPRTHRRGARSASRALCQPRRAPRAHARAVGVCGRADGERHSKVAVRRGTTPGGVGARAQHTRTTAHVADRTRARPLTDTSSRAPSLHHDRQPAALLPHHPVLPMPSSPPRVAAWRSPLTSTARTPPTPQACADAV